MKAKINKIIPFSNVDGPGNRTSIFFQGCHFKCLYCHNPETINLCNNCLDCASVCPKGALSVVDNKVQYDINKCINCDSCIKVCKHLSSPKIVEYSVEELVEKIKETKPFIRGITTSGGECTLYHNYLYELFKEVKKLDLTCLIDSNGCLPFESMEELIDISDGVMLDVKAIDDSFHQYLTSQSNDIVLKNLTYLLNKNKLEEVRTVILPNQEEENIKTVKEVSKIIGSKVRYKLIKYRYFGVREEGINVFSKTIVDDKTMKRMQEVALSYGCNTTIIN